MELRPFLEGATVALRPLSLEDVNEGYVNWLNDAEVCKYNSHHVFPNTLERAKRYVSDVQTSATDIVLAIIAKDTGAHIGNISLQKIHFIDQNAEYAVVLGDRTYWGKGIAQEASRLILAHAFNALNLHRVYCGTSDKNTPMQKLALSLGFKEEGKRREAMYKNGAFVDIIEYGLLRGEFVAQ